MATQKTDLTFRTDYTGNMVTAKNGEYIIQIVHMLFNMAPGMDEYNLNMGLNIEEKRIQSTVAGTRDTAYETEIGDQFVKYTDLIPINVTAMYTGDTFIVHMSIKYNDDIYNIDVTSDKETLSVLIS